jgi:hypothetical protein
VKLVLIALALCACERADKDPPRTKQVRIANPVPTVVLRDAGREPRRLHRLRPRVGVEAFDYRLTMTYDWSTGPREVQMLSMRQQRSVVEVRADGAFKEAWTVLDVAHEPTATRASRASPG